MAKFRMLAIAAIAMTSALGASHAHDPAPPGGSTVPPLLAWDQSQREAGFRNVENIFPTTQVAKGGKVRPLPTATKEVAIRYTQAGKAMDADAFMAANHVSGLIVLQDGKILLERYRQGFTATQRWTSFSVAKSVTSTLVGAALRDGFIRSIDDPVTRYVPQLKGSAYDGVTIRQLMMMSSGVRFDEDYENPSSDFMKLYDNDFIAAMKDSPRMWPAGSQFHYSTADSNILGTVVVQAVGKPLAQYLSEKIWAPYGMEDDARWLTIHGKEAGGANISMRLRDYARFGEFIRGDGMIDGKPVLADGWVKVATASHIKSDWSDIGYGYQWWVNPDGTFRALGIFGQMIFIDRPNRITVVALSAWPHPDRDDTYVYEDAFLAAVEKQLGHAR